MSATLAAYVTRAVPRYTSYPTVPHFNDAVGDARYREWLAQLDPQQSISMYLHVPFCRQLCWYCGCNMKLIARYDPVAAYVETLIKEIALLADALPACMTISHLHWGGGTPTALEPADLERVMATVQSRFILAANAEIAIESDPRTLTDAMVDRIGRLGFNRASFGVQEFDRRVQEAINRVQPPEMVEASVEALRDVGVRAINFDLIYGLPHQTVETLTRTIDRAVAMRPDRIALFGYAHVPWMAKKQRKIPQEHLPGAQARMTQAQAATDAFVDHGYQAVGLDHFARHDDPLAVAARSGDLRRNFQGYTTDRAETLLGLGTTSIGRTPGGYVQNLAATGLWARTVEAGALPIAKGHAFAGQDRVRADAIEQLMCYGAVDLGSITRPPDVPLDWWGHERQELLQFERDGMVTLDGDLLRLTPSGRPLVRTVAAVFDEYFAKAAARHSVAV